MEMNMAAHCGCFVVSGRRSGGQRYRCEASGLRFLARYSAWLGLVLLVSSSLAATPNGT